MINAKSLKKNIYSDLIENINNELLKNIYSKIQEAHKNNFTNLEHLNFHEEYSNLIHHLRGNNWLHEKQNFLLKKEDYLFLVRNNYSEYNIKSKKNGFILYFEIKKEYVIFYILY